MAPHGQTGAVKCNEGQGMPGSDKVDCPYKKAPFFNVLAAYWIQFMTHDWFSHLQEARNDQSRVMASLGCATERENNVERPLTSEDVAPLVWSQGNQMEAALTAAAEDPVKDTH